MPCVVIAESQGARLSSVRVFLVFLGYSIRYATTESFHILSRSVVVTQVSYHAALCSLLMQCHTDSAMCRPQSVIAVIMQCLPM